MSSYLAIEGVIGAGKTSLARLLAQRMAAKLILEEVDENPFLEEFYSDAERYGFQTQIFFLLNRYRQLSGLFQGELFHRGVVSDYILAKDKIFAYLNLNDNELFLYNHLYSLLEDKVPQQDLVIYLQASTDFLLRRIKERGRPFEQAITRDYIDALNQAYNHFFFHYHQTPLLVVKAEGLDFINQPQDLEWLWGELSSPPAGTRYISQ
jgi:deoxyguanosine kinase